MCVRVATRRAVSFFALSPPPHSSAVTFRSTARGRPYSLFALPSLLFCLFSHSTLCTSLLFFPPLSLCPSFGIICLAASTIWPARQGLRLRRCQLLPFLHSLQFLFFFVIIAWQLPLGARCKAYGQTGG